MNKISKQLKKLLAQAGWEPLRRGKGDHEIWFNPATGQKISIDDGSRSRHLANSLLKEAGLPKAF